MLVQDDCEQGLVSDSAILGFSFNLPMREESKRIEVGKERGFGRITRGRMTTAERLLRYRMRYVRLIKERHHYA